MHRRGRHAAPAAQRAAWSKKKKHCTTLARARAARARLLASTLYAHHTHTRTHTHAHNTSTHITQKLWRRRV